MWLNNLTIETFFNFFIGHSIAILSFIAAIASLIISWKAHTLQKKSDKDLERIENNTQRLEKTQDKLTSETEKIENNTQELRKVQDKLVFETEKNRLISFSHDSELSGEDKRYFRSEIENIFYKEKYDLRELNSNSIIEVLFIKQPNGLPKMVYPFNRSGDFPYFCIKVVKPYNNTIGIQKEEYFYLSYVFSDKSWYMGKGDPIKEYSRYKGIKVVFAGESFSGKGLPPPDVACKNC